jgi:hypothetical protein
MVLKDHPLVNALVYIEKNGTYDKKYVFYRILSVIFAASLDFKYQVLNLYSGEISFLSYERLFKAQETGSRIHTADNERFIYIDENDIVSNPADISNNIDGKYEKSYHLHGKYFSNKEDLFNAASSYNDQMEVIFNMNKAKEK